MAFKIYRDGNYIIIHNSENNREIEGLCRHVRFARHFPESTTFFVHGMTEQVKNGMDISEIVDELGAPYTLSSFIDFYRKNTGNFSLDSDELVTVNPTTLATSSNQIEMISQLDDILLEMQTDNLDKRLTVRLDEISDTLFYVGYALIGSLDSEAKWLIIKYTTTGVVLKSEYANGVEAFNQVWNDRTTLTYV